jgi:UDP:flavonoid glycosyltransferase YjiC (YdhE family)
MGRPYDYKVAYFISAHGYGHAARAAGVMEAMGECNQTIHFEIFTSVPQWFFDDSLSASFGYHSMLTDIGLVQKTPLKADLPETLRRLNRFLPLDRSGIAPIAAMLEKLKCRLVICDISPMGIAVARELGIPSVLVENFTWDWLYEGYLKEDGRIREYIDYLRELFQGADFHIQTEPVCCHRISDLTTLPVSRKPRTPAQEIRDRLKIPETANMVMLTMGGIPEQYPFLEQLTRKGDTYFVVAGARKREEVHGNLVLLPVRSGYFHPDLVNACDAVIGKAGYSTIAEIYYAGEPFGYVARKRFRESRILVSYVKNHMNGLPISENQFYHGGWLSSLPDLLALPRIHRQGLHGADQVAGFICDQILGIPRPDEAAKV